MPYTFVTYTLNSFFIKTHSSTAHAYSVHIFNFLNMDISYSEHDLNLRYKLGINFYSKLALSLVCWRIYYIVTKKLSTSIFKKATNDPKKLEQAYAQVLSITASLIALSITSLNHVPLFIENIKNPEKIFNRPLDPPGKFLMVTLFGYFLHDTIWCLTNGWHEITNYCHHILSVSFAFGMLVFDNTAIETFIPVFCSEISTVPLNLRWFQRLFSGRSNFAMDILFMATFFLGRIVAASYVTYWLVITEGPKMVRWSCYLMDGVNAFWFWKMIKMLKRRSNQRKDD